MTLRRALVAALAVAAGAFAYPAAASAGLSLSVQPLMTELHVSPGGSAGLSVRVTNGGDQAERVTVEPIDWSTTTDGDIRFGAVGTTGAHSVTKYLAMSLAPFVLAPGETRAIPLTLRLPASFPATAATYWGGFLVRSMDAGRPGVGPAGTVFVYETVGAPKTHLGLSAMRVTRSGQSGAVFTARLHNDAAAYARLSGRLVVSSAGRVVHDEDVSTVTIFPGESRVLARDLRGLPPGDYQAELSVDYGGNVVLSGTTDFRIR